jgi:hypothetical protein
MFMIERVSGFRYHKDYVHQVYKIKKTKEGMAQAPRAMCPAHEDLPEGSRSKTRRQRNASWKKVGSWLKGIFGHCAYAFERAYQTQLEQKEMRGAHLPPLDPIPPSPQFHPPSFTDSDDDEGDKHEQEQHSQGWDETLFSFQQRQQRQPPRRSTRSTRFTSHTMELRLQQLLVLAPAAHVVTTTSIGALLISRTVNFTLFSSFWCLVPKGEKLEGSTTFSTTTTCCCCSSFSCPFPLRVSLFGCECRLKTMFCNIALYYSICFGYGHVSVDCELACHIIARSTSFYEFAAV